MDNVQKVRDLLDATTTIYRPGPPFALSTISGVTVVDVWLDTPSVDDAPRDDGTVLIDVHFFIVAVDRRRAEEMRGIFEELLAAWPLDASYAPENRLAQGPSFIELGAQIGTFMGQQDALRLMALGQALDVWTVITPRRLFGIIGDTVTDEDANQMAGSGMVMIDGYRPEKSS